jgi:hypothetical protein
MENTESIEKRLWEAADDIRANSKLTSNEYYMPVLGLIFLRHVFNRFIKVEAGIKESLSSRGGVTRQITKEDFVSKSALFLREEARFDYLINLPEDRDRTQAITDAMEAIEEDYEDLDGVLPKEYHIFDNDLLTRLLKIFNDEALNNANGDVFGRIYEYFIMKFALQGAQDTGEFFTPVPLVQLIVNTIEPDSGIVLDPACGSGGMFVQARQFIDEKGVNPNSAVTFFEQEKTSATIRLAKMNLAVHGLEGRIAEANPFYEVQHNSGILREENFKRARDEFESLLESKFSSSEKIFQNFFERNPYYLPGVSIPSRFIIEPDENYAPFPGAVISQPPLRSNQEYIPDFLWLAYDKDTVYPVFIEIEAPSKNWFNKDETLSAKFNQAYHQLLTWKTWFDKEANKQVFWKTLKVPYFLSERSSVEPKFILIYGRDREFTSSDKVLIRKTMENAGFQLLTYDDLRLSYKKMDLTTAKLTSGGYVFYDNWSGHPVRFLLTDIELAGGDKDFYQLMKPLIEKYTGDNIRLLPEVDWAKLTFEGSNKATIVIRHGGRNYLSKNY